MVDHVTEEQAREMWCPFARVAQMVDGREDGAHGVASANRMTHAGDECRCIASACMAWRKTKESYWKTRSGKVIQTHVEPQTAGEPGRNAWVKKGYCGLAGKPND